MPLTSFPQNVQSTYPDIATFSGFDWLAADSTVANSDLAASDAGVNAELSLGELDLAFMGWDGGGGGNTDDLFDGFFFGSGVGG